MVYGNHNGRSGVGIAYSRNPETGEPNLYGEYIRRGEGDDIVHTSDAPPPIQDLRFTNALALEQLGHYLQVLEQNYKDAQLVEFVIDDGRLSVLERKPIHKSPHATVRIAVDMVKSRILTEREAIMKVDPAQVRPAHLLVVYCTASLPFVLFHNCFNHDSDDIFPLSDAGSSACKRLQECDWRRQQGFCWGGVRPSGVLSS